jgi:hypothetical protein
MKHQIIAILALFGVAAMPPAFAVEPSLVNYRDRVSWSEVEYSNFDGLYVNDRHTGIGGDRDYFVSQWSRKAIRLTFRDSFIASISIVPRVRYRSRRHYNHRRKKWESISFPEVVNERVANWSYHEYSPLAIHFRINDEEYTYNDGEVAPELANALANAPAENMIVRLEFAESNQHNLKPLMEVEIGKRTVLAWRQVFAEEPDRAEIQRIINQNSERNEIKPRESRR